jgi:hypothetical protein
MVPTAFDKLMHPIVIAGAIASGQWLATALHITH